MDVDLAALKAIERDRDIPMDYLLKTLEDALLNAYHKTPHALRGVKVEVDRKSGKVSVLAPEFDDAAQPFQIRRVLCIVLCREEKLHQRRHS